MKTLQQNQDNLCFYRETYHSAEMGCSPPEEHPFISAHFLSGSRNESENLTVIQPPVPLHLSAAITPSPAAVFSGKTLPPPDQVDFGNPETGIGEVVISEEKEPRQSTLILPDGTEMGWLADFQAPTAQLPRIKNATLENVKKAQPCSPTRIDTIFNDYLSKIETAAMKEFTKLSEHSFSFPGDGGNLGRTRTGRGIIPGLGGLQRTPTGEQTSRAANQSAGGHAHQSDDSNDPGGGGGGAGDPGRGAGAATPVTPGWSNIEIAIDPKMLGESAKPYTKASCKNPFLTRVKALFQRITARPTDKFSWLPEEEGVPAENRTFLGLIISHIVLNEGPISVEQNGLIDMFTYAAPSQQVLDPNNLFEPQAGPAPVVRPSHPSHRRIQGVKVDFSAKYVLSGVSHDDPRQFFTVVDEAGAPPPDEPMEVFLRPALVLASKMLQDMKVKRIKPTIRCGFSPPDNIVIRGTLVMDEIMPMLAKVTKLLDGVYNAQLAADRLASALEEVNEDRIDAIEEEFEMLVVDADGVPSSTLRDRVFKLAEGARCVNKLYNRYEMLVREIDHDGIKEDAAKRTFGNPAQLIRFLRNCSDASCPWVREHKKWIPVNPTLAAVSSDGQHILSGGRLKITQSPSRFLVERHLTHIDATLHRITELKKQVFARIPNQAQAPGGSSNSKTAEATTRVGKVLDPSEQVEENKLIEQVGGLEQFVTPIRPPPGFNKLQRPEVCRSTEQDGSFCGEDNQRRTPPYPHALLQAGADLCKFLLEDGPGCHTPYHILSGYIDQLSEIIKEVRKAEWTGNVMLTTEHQHVRNDLTRIKTVLQGYLADQNKEQKSKEAQDREVARSLSFAKGPILKEEGENIDQFLEYHEAFKSSNPLARALRMKNDLPKRLQTRVENISDPDEIEQFLRDLFLQSDVLIPQALKLVTDQKINPRVNSREEQASYSSINSLIKRLEKQDLLGRLDFTMISACLARLSPQRIDEFELSWLKTKMRNKNISTSEEEELKRDEFIAFIQLHEILLQKRTVQNSLNKREDKKNSERAFHTRETKLDKRKKNKEGDRGHKRPGDGAAGGAGDGSTPGGDQYTCPLCKVAGGHPIRAGPRAGQSRKTLARCEVMKSTPPNQRLALVLKHKSCARCLQTSHQLPDCKVDENSSWLTHPECPELHNPFVCPMKKVEKSFATRSTSPGSKDMVINLAEKALLRDQSGRSHSVLAVHDGCSDSSWVSSNLAKSFPPKKKKRVTVPLHTIQGTTSFRTWEYHLQILVGDTYRAIKVFESPDIGTVHYNSELPSVLKNALHSDIHLPQGSVDLLIGLREHGLSPDTLRVAPGGHKSCPSCPGGHKSCPSCSQPQTPNLKLYQSSLVPSRRLACGTIPTTLIAGLSTEERSMFTQSELTRILTQDKGIDSVPQLCDLCRNKSQDCSSCKLINRPTSLKELTENELIKKNLFFDKNKKRVSCKYTPTFSSWAQIFPPHLKNEKQARKVSQGLLKSLNKSNMLQQFQEVFDTFVKEGIFQELTKEEMKAWEEKGQGVNYIHFHHVLKEQAQATKQKLRIVTNSSACRSGIVDGKQVQCSLNSCLPQGSVSFNQLEEVAINWMASPVSLLLDVKKAFSNIKSCDGDDQNKHLRRMIWYRNLAPNVGHEDAEEVTYGISPCHYGDSNASCLLANTMLKISDDMADDGLKLESSKFLKFNFADDEICGCDDVAEAFQLDAIFRKYLGNYSMELHEAIVTSAEGRHMTQHGEPLKQPPDGESPTMKTMGFRYSPYSDSYAVPIQKRFKEPKRGKFKMKIGEDLTKESIMAMDRLSMRQIASFNASIFDLCGHLAPLKIFGKRLLARIMEASPPTTKQAWDQDLGPELFEEAKQYLLLMTSVVEPEFQRTPPPGELLDLACFHDGSSCAYGTGVWGIWSGANKGEKKTKLLYAKARTARRTIPDQELSSLHQSVQLSKVFTRIFPGLKRIHHLGDSEVSHKQIASINCPKDTWTMNRVRAVVNNTKEMQSQGVEVSFYHIKSELNLADRISKPVENAAEFVHSSDWKIGLSFLSQPISEWPVDKTMRLEGELITEVQVGQPFGDGGDGGDGGDDGDHGEPSTPAPRTPSRAERTMMTVDGEEPKVDGEEPTNEMDKNQDASGKGKAQAGDGQDGERASRAVRSASGAVRSQSTAGDGQGTAGKEDNAALPIFTDLLQNVSRIRIATRTIARLKNMAKRKSFLGLKEKLTEEEESAAWFLLLKDQQMTMDKKRIFEEKYMVFDEDGITFSRQKWDIVTHKDLFQVDKLPVVDVDSRLGQLLLANAHRPPAGPCRTRSHTKYHFRSCRVAALLTGPVERRLTSLMSTCVSCKKRKIGLKNGELTCYSPRTKADRFKVANPLPFSKVACDTLGPIRVSLDTSGCGTRKTARHADHHILVIACVAGSGACKYIQIPSTSADAFAMGLHRLVAYTGYPPSVIFTDFGSGLVSAGKKEEKRVSENKNMNEDDEEEDIPKSVTDRYPNIKFECAKSSEQAKNGKAEFLVKAYKQYVKDVLYLKPSASLPEFTVLGLDLLCEEVTRTINQRPTAYLGEQDLVLCPNSFLMAGFSDRVWGVDGELPTKYLQLEKYRERMYEVLRQMMISADFTPKKWTKDERMPMIGDICLMTRQKGKISQILEYARIMDVEDQGRTLKLRVCRQGTANVKDITASSRLAHLLFRP